MESGVNGVRLGVGLMVAQQVLFTVDTAAIHQLAGHVSLWQLGLLRAVGGICLVACLAPAFGWQVFHTRQLGLQALRVTVTIAYAWVLIYSFAYIPFADATALSYTMAIYVALLAGPILGEVVGLRRGLAAVVGLAGAVLIIRPGFSQLSWIYFAVLVLTSANGLAVVLNRALQRYDSPVTIMAYVNVAMLAMFLPGAFEPLPSALLWPWLLAATITGPLGMFTGIVALRYADASTLAPLSYVRLVMAIVLGAVFFSEPVGLATLLGALVIIVACVLAALGSDARIGQHGLVRKRDRDSTLRGARKTGPTVVLEEGRQGDGRGVGI
jgi:drug/metabolite transporter (DMT)-like permease